MIFKCKDKELEYGEKIIMMGIVNITPDSFSDGGDYFNCDKAVEHALEHIENGAKIVDLGAQSTRPGHKSVSADEEWERLEPVIKKLREKTDAIISVDTYYPEVARKAVLNGADIINDVSAAVSDEMCEVVKETGAAWIIMHNGGEDKEDIIEDVKIFFEKSLEKTRKFGIDDEKICFDMGIGFNKTREQDFQLIANVEKYKIKGFPLLFATSRKRVIGEGSNQPDPKQRIYGNIAADTSAIMGGADMVRVHDTFFEKQGILMAENIRKRKIDG